MLRKQLTELGLTKYEVGAYLCILEHGIAEAGLVYKEAKIPYGKIYETLNSLVSRGLLEIQNTRPKKYMVKKAKIAFNEFYSQVKNQMDKNLEEKRKLITNIGEEIDKIGIQTKSEKSFWKTAMDKEIPQMIKSNFEEAEKEICILLYIPKRITKNSNFHEQEEDDFALTQSEMMKAFSRGVKLKILSSEEIAEMHSSENSTHSQNIEIKFTDKPFPAYFTIIDEDKVIFSIIDPVEQNSVIAMTKVWDQRLAKRLKEKFDKMWKTAKKYIRKI